MHSSFGGRKGFRPSGSRQYLTVISSCRNSISASAVCAFNLSAITQAFNGPFHYQENPRTAWLSSPNPLPNFQVTHIK